MTALRPSDKVASNPTPAVTATDLNSLRALRFFRVYHLKPLLDILPDLTPAKQYQAYGRDGEAQADANRVDVSDKT
jgi:hypothetical protein